MSNDTTQTATPLTATNQQFSDYLDSTDLNDYFRLTLTRRSSLNLVLNNVTADANLQLLDIGGSVLQSSTNQGQSTELINRILEPGTYYVRAYLAGGNIAIYNLSLSLESGGGVITIWRDYSTGNNTLWFMGGPNSTSQVASVPLPTVSTNWAIEGVADWNQDGTPDFLWRDYVSGLNGYWFMGGNNGNEIIGIAYLPDVATNWQVGGVGDVNGDGTPDILWRDYAYGYTGFWLMGGTNNAEIIGVPEIFVAPTNWRAEELADFNGDGKLDIFWHDTATGGTGVWYMDGTAYTSSEFLAAYASPDAQVQGIIDFNQDRNPDILWKLPNGDNQIWLMQGINVIGTDSLGFTPATTWITPFRVAGNLTPIDPAGNTQATAFNIGNLTRPATYQDRISTTDPEDYYRFTLDSSYDVTLSLSGLPSSSLQLLNSTGTILTSTANLIAGTYYVRVFNGSGDYTLSLAAAPPSLIPPSISIAATTPNASEPGTNGVFTITRSGSTTAALTIAYTISGTATNGTDYQTLGTSVVIPAGQTSVTIPIAVLDDLLVEGNETVILTLSPNANYALGTSTATVTIADNDQPPVLPTVSISASTNAAEPSTHGSFTITRTGSSAQALTIRYAVTGTATSGTDYQSLGQTVVIPAGQSSVTVPVIVQDDTQVETDETVILTLTSDPAYTIGTTPSRTLTITDNDIAGDTAGNTLATARDLGTLTPTQQNLIERVDNGDKKDYYRVVMATRGTLRATVTNNTADLDIELLSSTGTLIHFSDNTGVKDESISRIVPAGTYYLFVYPFGSAQSNYTLTVWRV